VNPPDTHTIGGNAKSETIDIALVDSYPRNDEINPPCTDEADKQLRESLQQEGQRDPLHVVPLKNGRFLLLDGHRRLREMLAFGLTPVKVIIRWDLADAGDDAIHLAYLNFNIHRRQLDPLALANNLRERIEAKKRKLGTQGSAGDRSALADAMTKLLGGNRRNAFRYVHGSFAPAVVQSAHRKGVLGLDDLARLGMKPPELQQQVADEIAALGSVSKTKVTQIVRQHIGKQPSSRIKRFTPIAVRMVRHLDKDLADLGGRFDQIYGPELAPYRGRLESARKAIDKLIRASKRRGSSIASAMADDS
jgi:hypothetical protein